VDCVGDGGSGGLNCYLFLVIVSHLVKGDSYPESCAQRTAEGGGRRIFFVSHHYVAHGWKAVVGFLGERGLDIPLG